MKVAFISRATLYSSPGGDTKQLDMTAENLRALGVSVDIYLTTDKIPYQDYDLLHFFNVIRPADIIVHIKHSGKPYVVSTIFVDFGSFEKKGRSGFKGILSKLLPEGTIEYIKVLARRIKNAERIVSPQYLLWGHTRSLKYVVNNAAMLLPNSESEYQRFRNKYGIDHAYRVVPNGIDEQIYKQAAALVTKDKTTIACVARFEERKNQLNLIRALNGTKYQVYFAGTPSPNNVAYYERCKAEAGANIHFEGWITGKELDLLYAAAKVHILPSYFETTGLSSLEAAVMGCNIVVTECGDTRDYFGDNAWYCIPEDPVSIKDAIDSAYAAPYNEAFRDYILEHYTWKKAAEITLQSYNDVLK